MQNDWGWRDPNKELKEFNEIKDIKDSVRFVELFIFLNLFNIFNVITSPLQHGLQKCNPAYKDLWDL